MINYIKQFTRPRSEWFPYQHLLLLAGVIYAFTLPVAAGWWVAAFAMWFAIIALGINFTYHRLLSHRSFKTYKIVEYAFSLLGILANTGSPLAWVMMHRQHHHYTDKEYDPHSPHEHGWKILFSFYIYNFIKMTPYQYTYFNIFAGKKDRNASNCKEISIKSCEFSRKRLKSPVQK